METHVPVFKLGHRSSNLEEEMEYAPLCCNIISLLNEGMQLSNWARNIQDSHHFLTYMRIGSWNMLNQVGLGFLCV